MSARLCEKCNGSGYGVTFDSQCPDCDGCGTTNGKPPVYLGSYEDRSGRTVYSWEFLHRGQLGRSFSARTALRRARRHAELSGTVLMISPAVNALEEAR